MEERANAFLGEEKLSTLMKMYSVPCIISLLVAALYNIVDQIFIANASYLGSYGNAANNVVFPLTIVALSLAVMIGDGCCAYVSICLGKNEKEDAHKSIGCAVVLVIIVGLLVAAVYAVLQEAILTFFGGKVNAETYACAKEYFTFITMGIPIYMFGQCLNPIIRSDGSPRFAMASTVLGAVFNIIFDPICIYGLHWGMKGAAIATVGGQILTAVLAIWYLFHMKAVRLERKSFGIFPGLMRAFLPLGITSFGSQISVVGSMAAVNNR
ncbi:MAG: polysaccharide biosynthesis C-terminal domain-containing protein, partial [Lachnospiraceae bacterium]|nr:polysaccharide biosynthesis C-terminal domain-containing protein [Lachnospiraceae bacterium]